MAVNPGKPSVVRNYVVGAGQALQLDDLYAECYLVIEGAVLGQTEQAAKSALSSGVTLMEVIGPLRQLVGVWVAAPAQTLVTVISR